IGSFGGNTAASWWLFCQTRGFWKCEWLVGSGSCVGSNRKCDMASLLTVPENYASSCENLVVLLGLSSAHLPFVSRFSTWPIAPSYADSRLDERNGIAM